eukprot:TRINITY_DN395_c0_g1_i5.p1 TRINITY_DN395_c0_g1~~TRINITY_DN395_c0_g1_i5.p1  ORF type:complete len:369 (-),score=56.03 TRINITY_DN395_c0_g1_i5:53-1159(-)
MDALRWSTIKDFKAPRFVECTAGNFDSLSQKLQDEKIYFSLPDLLGRAAFGNNADALLGEVGGSESVVLTEANLPLHSHLVSVRNGTAETVSFSGNFFAAGIDEKSNYVYLHTSPIVRMHSDMVGEAGLGKPHENMPPYIMLTPLICVNENGCSRDDTFDCLNIDEYPFISEPLVKCTGQDQFGVVDDVVIAGDGVIVSDVAVSGSLTVNGSLNVQNDVKITLKLSASSLATVMPKVIVGGCVSWEGDLHLESADVIEGGFSAVLVEFQCASPPSFPTVDISGLKFDECKEASSVQEVDSHSLSIFVSIQESPDCREAGGSDNNALFALLALPLICLCIIIIIVIVSVASIWSIKKQKKLKKLFTGLS